MPKEIFPAFEVFPSCTKLQGKPSIELLLHSYDLDDWARSMVRGDRLDDLDFGPWYAHREREIKYNQGLVDGELNRRHGQNIHLVMAAAEAYKLHFERGYTLDQAMVEGLKYARVEHAESWQVRAVTEYLQEYLGQDAYWQAKEVPATFYKPEYIS